MKYTVNPDGTITFDKTVETGTSNSSSSLDKEMVERLGEYDTHKLFKWNLEVVKHTQYQILVLKCM